MISDLLASGVSGTSASDASVMMVVSSKSISDWELWGVKNAGSVNAVLRKAGAVLVRCRLGLKRDREGAAATDWLRGLGCLGAALELKGRIGVEAVALVLNGFWGVLADTG